MSAPDSSYAACARWLQGRQAHWQRLEGLLGRQRGRPAREADEVLALLQDYRSLARDVSLARRAMPDSRVTRYLEGLLARGYEVIHRPPQRTWARLRRLFVREVPADAAALWRPILASLAIFAGSGLIGAWLVHTYPELIALFASEQMIETVQSGALWTDDLLNVAPSSLLSLGIMANNIMVTLFAFGLGVFYGVGTLYILGLNGLMLGAVFAFTAHYGLDGRLFAFVVAHGVVELSVIVLAGAAGIRLGEALIRPGDRSRLEAFQAAVAQAGRLVGVAVPFLVGAGLIEGYVSPDDRFGLVTRVTVGLSYFAFFLLVLTGRLWRLSPRVRARA